MASTPNEEGIVQAMKSMKTITTDPNFKAGKANITASFPRPPIDFVGTVGQTPKAKTTDKKSKSNTKVLNHKKPSHPTTKSKSNVSSTTKSLPPPPVHQTEPDTNSQLFGTLLNSLKTRPTGVTESIRRTSPTEKRGKTAKRNTKKIRKGYASSSSSSSSASSASSSSDNSSSIESTSSRSSLPSGTMSSASSGNLSSEADQKKIEKEKKKRKDELLQEKVEMLTRITNLSKNGFTPTRKWDVKDDIDEIRYECYRMQRECNSKKSIKIMRRVLVTITTLIETGNSYFNPFNLRLEGFSENMMLNLDDYDDCFEQIHHKYSGRSSMGPEMQILFTFMSAAIFHHAGNVIGGNKRGTSSDKTKSKPSPMSSVMSMMGMLSGVNNSSSASNYPIPRATPAPRNKTDMSPANEDGSKPKRKIMRGPGASSIPMSIFENSNNQTVPSMTLPSEA